MELKLNLNTTTKYYQLIGQLEEYRGWRCHVLVVLLGTTDPYFRKSLEEYAAKNSDYLGNEIRIMTK